MLNLDELRNATMGLPLLRNCRASEWFDSISGVAVSAFLIVGINCVVRGECRSLKKVNGA